MRLVFERVFYEATFFGMVAGGYLAWVSMLYFIRYNHSNIMDIVYALVVIVVWVIQIVLFLRKETEKIDLDRWRDLSPKDKKDEARTVVILSGYGEFRELNKIFLTAESVESEECKRKKFFVLAMVL